MIITEFDSTQEFADEVGELRAISGHMLRATRVEIPEDNFGQDLHSSTEEDGTLEKKTMDPKIDGLFASTSIMFYSCRRQHRSQPIFVSPETVDTRTGVTVFMN
ncbi:hypothetical protein Tco_0215571 [Tanacetum coccineum]